MTGPMSLEEFKRNCRIFRNVMGLGRLDIEYRAYCGFLEVVGPKEAEEFLAHGRMSVNGWVLYSDLSIGKDTDDKKVRRHRMSCTDGGSYALPYFDRVVQKYLYLKHSPDRIVEIGMRHADPHTRPLLKSVDGGDTIDRVTYPFEAVRKSGKLFVRAGEEVKVTGMSEVAHHVFRIWYSRFRFKRRGDVTVISSKDTDYSVFGEEVAKIPGTMIPGRHVQHFRHFYQHRAEGILRDDFKVKVGPAVSGRMENMFTMTEMLFGTDLTRRLTTNKGFGHMVNSVFGRRRFKGMLNTPLSVSLAAMLSCQKDASLFDIIDFYESRPELLKHLRRARRRRRRPFAVTGPVYGDDDALFLGNDEELVVPAAPAVWGM